MDISQSKEHSHEGSQAAVEANKIKSTMIEKAKEAGPSGSRSNKEIMGSTLKDVSNDVLAALPRRQGQQYFGYNFLLLFRIIFVLNKLRY